MADGYPMLQQATEPPMYDAPPLVVNREQVVLEPLRGTHVVVACPHCGHTGPAAVSKASRMALEHLGVQPSMHARTLINTFTFLVLQPAACRLANARSACTSSGCMSSTGGCAVQESGFVTFFSSFMLCFLGCCILSVFPFCSDCTKVSSCTMVRSTASHELLGCLAGQRILFWRLLTEDALYRTGSTAARGAARCLAGSGHEQFLAAWRCSGGDTTLLILLALLLPHLGGLC